MPSWLDIAAWPERAILRRARLPPDLDAALARGEEFPAAETGADPAALARVADAFRSFYKSGLYPATQLCIRHRGAVLLQRAYGFRSGAAPEDPRDAPRVPCGVDTPFLLYSASKAVAAMLIHKLDEQHMIHLDDRVCDYIDGFERHGKQWITLRHVLGHRAGIPNLPPEAVDLDLLGDPERVVEILCHQHPTSRAGRRLAYHAVTGGFVLGEVVRRVTGQTLRELMAKEVCEPLGLRWMNFGVAPADLPQLAVDAVTGPPIVPPFSWILERALGTPFENVVQLGNDPRFRTGIVPAANVAATADELCRWFECLRRGGELDGVRILDERTVRHASSEQTYLEVDLTLILPIRYGLGFMLGDSPLGLFGMQTPHAFGHLGFTNVFGWADPDRELSVALLTSGKPFASLESARLVQLLYRIGRAFPAAA